MGLFDRFRRRSRGRLAAPGGAAAGDGDDSVDEDYLDGWLTARRGVEGFVEPPTSVSEVTLLLVAHDGEWTRRRVPDARWAHRYCNRHQVPSYDAALVGIPQRMRDYNHRVSQQRKQARRARRDDDRSR